MQKCSVVVVGNALLAEVLCRSLTASGRAAVPVAPCPTMQLLAKIRAHRPDVVLLDLDLRPFRESARLIGPLTAAGAQVVVVTGVDDRLRVAAAVERGAVAYRSKADGFDALLATASAVLAGHGALDADARAELLSDLNRARQDRAATLAPFHRLTDREQEALRSIASGLSVQDIATDWVVSEATVRTHVRGVLGKLDVRSQIGAVAAAMRTGWLEPPAA
jgi:DNA-binding NarL/FixJ family response regulator